MKTIKERLLSLIEGSAVINVGLKGGDLQTRVLTTVVVLALIVLVSPPSGVSDAALRIATLATAMTGVVFLMTGLVFAARTHYAGIVLTTVPLLLKWLVSAEQRWLAVILGIVALSSSVLNLKTRQCGINKLLRISSV